MNNVLKIAARVLGSQIVRGVMSEVPEFLLEHRRKTGAARWDEMWNGVLHMTPTPSREHQDFCFELEAWLREHWGRPQGNRVHHDVNLASVGGWPNDYRIPDLLLVTPDRFHVDHNVYLEGPPWSLWNCIARATRPTRNWNFTLNWKCPKPGSFIGTHASLKSIGSATMNIARRGNDPNWLAGQSSHGDLDEIAAFSKADASAER